VAVLRRTEASCVWNLRFAQLTVPRAQINNGSV
jgi:hypothetical protein